TILNRQSLFKNMRLSWQITKRNKFRLVIEIVILELIIGAILTRHHILYQHSYLQKRLPSTIVEVVSYTYYVLLILYTQLKKK
ncbi:glycerophosphoryl diester phosphodiesterase membrane domain-containing protein, partial [Staphylococcus aureus]|uniref:glycerophosphoryl diester phosphodiesterase membrane domain-containing protein n=1 Tax=Staphylococcus aureus TaxID=1280 RepID=UPI001F18C7C3